MISFCLVLKTFELEAFELEAFEVEVFELETCINLFRTKTKKIETMSVEEKRVILSVTSPKTIKASVEPKTKHDFEPKDYESRKCDKFIIHVGKETLDTTRGLLLTKPDTLLGRYAADLEGPTIIEIVGEDPELFRHVLRYYLSGHLYEAPSKDFKRNIPIFCMFNRFELAEIDISQYKRLVRWGQ